MKRQQEPIKMKAKYQKMSTLQLDLENVPDEIMINEIKRRKNTIDQLLDDLPGDALLDAIKRRKTKISSLKLEELATRDKPELEDLPNEVLLKIFSYVNHNYLIRCGQLSKRMKSICHDSSLWQKIELKPKLGILNVPTGFINFALSNGCKYLSLCHGVNLQGSLKLNKASNK